MSELQVIYTQTQNLTEEWLRPFLLFVLTTTKYTQTYTMGYNTFDQLTSVKVGTTTLATYAYAANNGLLSSMTYGNGAVVSYTYDELERISSVVYDDGTTITYTYNGLGALGKLTDSRGRTYLYNYDSLGRLISMSERATNGRPYGQNRSAVRGAGAGRPGVRPLHQSHRHSANQRGRLIAAPTDTRQIITKS